MTKKNKKRAKKVLREMENFIQMYAWAGFKEAVHYSNEFDLDVIGLVVGYIAGYTPSGL